MNVVDVRELDSDEPREWRFEMPLQSGRCPRCGNRTRTLRFEQDHLEARCAACGTRLVAWHDLLVAW
jgi:DNA-directed RNA polymerase subunit RPC12/RpoP